MLLTVNTFLSLDGVMQGPGAPDEDRSGGFALGGWTAPHFDEGMGRIVTSWFDQADAFLLGRTTYQLFAGFWPQVTDLDDPVARALNALPKHVVSNTLENADWSNSTVIAADQIAELKAKPGRELQVHGSCGLVHYLHDQGLIDEYRLVYFPVVLGQGKRLFPEGAVPSNFTLVGTETTAAGVVQHTLRPAPFRTGAFEIRDGQDVVAN
jgi:dihydrofolate reductase